MKRFFPLLLSMFVIGLANNAWTTEPPLPKFEAQTIDSTVAIGYGVAIGDVDGDDKPDILLADKRQIVWYRNGDWETVRDGGRLDGTRRRVHRRPRHQRRRTRGSGRGRQLESR